VECSCQFTGVVEAQHLLNPFIFTWQGIFVEYYCSNTIIDA